MRPHMGGTPPDRPRVCGLPCVHQPYQQPGMHGHRVKHAEHAPALVCSLGAVSDYAGLHQHAGGIAEDPFHRPTSTATTDQGVGQRKGSGRNLPSQLSLHLRREASPCELVSRHGHTRQKYKATHPASRIAGQTPGGSSAAAAPRSHKPCLDHCTSPYIPAASASLLQPVDSLAGTASSGGCMSPGARRLNYTSSLCGMWDPCQHADPALPH